MLTLAVGSSVCLSTLAHSCSAEIEETMKKADAAYIARLDPAQAQAALTGYEEALNKDPKCSVAFWRASRAAWWVAHQETKKAEKAQEYEKGINYAQQAIQLSSNTPEGYFWLAANQGSYGEFKGVMKSLSSVKPMRQSLNKILEIDPTFEGGAASRVLGTINYKVPGFAGGNKKQAREQLTTAFNQAPQNPFNLYYMAEFHQVMGEKEEAKKLLETLNSLSEEGDRKADVVMMKKKGAALSAKLK